MGSGGCSPLITGLSVHNIFDGKHILTHFYGNSLKFQVNIKSESIILIFQIKKLKNQNTIILNLRYWIRPTYNYWFNKKFKVKKVSNIKRYYSSKTTK